MNRLKEFRLAKGMTQVELAEKSGVIQTDISRAEKGVRDLKGSAWASLARVLNCTVDELLGTKEDSCIINPQQFV